MKQHNSSYTYWENSFKACKNRSDYYQYYVANINNNENPFLDKALRKLDQFKSYEKEFYDCWNNVIDLENYILKYINTDNPYVHDAKIRIVELSKMSTPRWGYYRFLFGIRSFLLAVGCLFIVLSVAGTSNNILALIGVMAIVGIGIFTVGGVWLIFNGVKTLKNHNN